ncbi:heme-binding protein [Xanthomonas citri pv. mangiferaeindicae]|uniref:GlcG/HbpS family heme-binding protein n=1 Tax=Xanthomonas citri TaxID=346 RepID=UPI0002552489|nr:heme-binding protein [Xanthomonas citri]OOW49684.1 hypothetical protein Xcnt_16360 [Xanthomonas campestris pv. centellae]UDB90097.1 heme-binding protein [Xanthomonas citri pv. mangiferaeindicae]UDI81750.1 hypothetical protein XCM_12170 [Xanthomonas citri pv. mangiferaeindicae]CCG38063.1 conserved hypothetical protein [Xanthomonas citri pv. mangiferaeindicae LMG 941]
MSHALNESTIQHVIERAQVCAREQHFAINIAVMDEAGLLRGFLRMDDAVPGAIDVSIKKARTAALFRTDSLELGVAAQPGGPIYTLEATNGGLISFGGGVVLRDEDRVIGAVGVAGATVEADQAIALYAAGRV